MGKKYGTDITLKEKMYELVDRYETSRMYEALENNTHEQINVSMEEIRMEAEKLQQNVTNEETKIRITALIRSCNDAMYSHRMYTEDGQFIVLETNDSKGKYVMISTSFKGMNHYIDVCEYDDAIKHREAVLNNDSFLKIRVSARTYSEAGELLEQVRANSGDSTVLYGRKESRTIWTDH